jgi:hypothetical protein
MNNEMPIPIQIAAMARPVVVSGCLAEMREPMTPVSTLAAIIVTGHAIADGPKADKAMAM